MARHTSRFVGLIAAIIVLLALSACSGFGAGEAKEPPPAPVPAKQRQMSSSQPEAQPKFDKPPVRNAPTNSPPPALHIPHNVKGVYVSSGALHSKKWSRIRRLIGRTELNAVVIDVKNDVGRLTSSTVSDTLNELKKENIYTIARIVAFKDPSAAKQHPDWAIQYKNGAVWKDDNGLSWLDPYNEHAWKYIVDIARQAAKLGFHEIQFDYVRFPEQKMTGVVYRNKHNETKAEVIQRFLQTATDEIHAAGSAVSADVFGLATTARDDLGIGQQWEKLSTVADVLSPMIYPSHYASGSYGVRHPDMHPHHIVGKAVKDAQRRNAALRKANLPAAQVRPWLQHFTASWLHPHSMYGKSAIDDQIRALQEQGITQYLLWDPNCNYSP